MVNFKMHVHSPGFTIFRRIFVLCIVKFMARDKYLYVLECWGAWKYCWHSFGERVSHFASCCDPQARWKVSTMIPRWRQVVLLLVYFLVLMLVARVIDLLIWWAHVVLRPGDLWPPDFVFFVLTGICRDWRLIRKLTPGWCSASGSSRPCWTPGVLATLAAWRSTNLRNWSTTQVIKFWKLWVPNNKYINNIAATYIF